MFVVAGEVGGKEEMNMPLLTSEIPTGLWWS
jgi:hypothetical protein